MSLRTERDKLDDINNEPNWQYKLLTNILNSIQKLNKETRRKKMVTLRAHLMFVIMVIGHVSIGNGLKSDKLCGQCSTCHEEKCPASEAYPHMTAWDDSLIAGALQSDYVDINDRGVYSVPNIKGGESKKYNAYFGWESTSGSASGYHRQFS